MANDDDQSGASCASARPSARRRASTRSNSLTLGIGPTRTRYNERPFTLILAHEALRDTLAAQPFQQPRCILFGAEGAGLHEQRLRSLRRCRRRSLLRRRQCAHFDERGSILQHVELAGRRVGQVDDAAVLERTAIVHAHDDAAAVAKVRDLYVCRQRQCLVCGGHRIHVVTLAVRRSRCVKPRSVPRRDAALVITLGRIEYEVALPEHGVEGRIAALRARLRPRDRFWYRRDVAGRHVARRRQWRQRRCLVRSAGASSAVRAAARMQSQD